MDIERSDGSVTPPASAMNKGKQRDSPNAGVIDPALGGEAATPKADDADQKQEDWLEALRLIEWMREFIRKQVETVTEEEAKNEDVKTEHVDAIMGEASDDSEQRKKDEEQLYPVLRHVEQDA